MPGDDGLIRVRAVLSPDAEMDPETHDRLTLRLRRELVEVFVRRHSAE